MTTTMPTVTASHRRALRAWLLWTAGVLAFPVAGIAGTAFAGRVDSPAAALLGGLAAGAVLGLGQALLSSGRLPMLRWTAATALGMSAGLLLGAQAVGYGTTLAQIAVMGALTGAVLGPAQALALPPGARSRWVWAVAMPVLWPTGWAVTASIAIPVEEQLTLFGASGAVTVSALLGILLHTLLPPPTTQASPAPGTTHTTHANPVGDRS
jgi:hypothetical protein